MMILLIAAALSIPVLLFLIILLSLAEQRFNHIGGELRSKRMNRRSQIYRRPLNMEELMYHFSLEVVNLKAVLASMIATIAVTLCFVIIFTDELF